MKLARWLIGLVGFIAVLILAVYGVARIEPRDNRCLELADAFGWSAVTTDAGIGQSLPDHREGTRKGNLIPMIISPDKQHMLAWQPGPSGGNQIIWKDAYPPRTVLLDKTGGVVSAVNWSPDSMTVSYIFQSNTLAMWNMLDVRDGQIHSIAMQGNHADYFSPSQGEFGDWSPDSRILAVVTMNSSDRVRLYLRERDSNTFRAIDLPNLAGISTMEWSPDGQFFVVISPNTQILGQIGVSIYTRADGRVISLLGRDPGSAYDSVLATGTVWSPDQRYFITHKVHQSDGTSDSWDMYGIDGRVIPQVAEGDQLIMWRPSNAHLLIESGNGQLIDLDPATGDKTTLVDHVLDTEFFQGMQSVIVASTQPDGSVAIDLLDLQTGTQTRVMSGISHFERFESRLAAKGIEAVAWTAQSRFHLTFLDRGGQIRQDFAGLDPSGRVFGTFGADQAVYAQTLDAAGAKPFAPLILKLQSGEQLPLKTPVTRIFQAVEDPQTGRFVIHPAMGDSYNQQMFTSAGDPVVLGDTFARESDFVAPDNTRAVGWTDDAASPIELHLASGERRVLQTKLSDGNPLEVRWRSDSSAFALIQSSTTGGALWQTRVEIYSADGDFRGSSEVITDFDLNQIQWTDCS